jgi:hypothetical protein
VKGRAVALALALTTLAAGSAEAHQDSVTHVRVTAEGREVHAELQIEAVDLNEAMRVPAARTLSREEALAGADRVAAYAAARLHVRDAVAACRAGEHSARTVDRRDTWVLVLRLTYVCPHAVDALSLRYDLFFDVDPRHQGMTTVTLAGRDAQHVFREATRDLTLDARSTLGRQLATYVSLGVDHIFLGYDHIAFLVGLLLAVGDKARRESARAVLAIVTSFTLAHSITLVSAALGLVRVSPAVVEPAIAASIAFIAVENLLPREPRRRPALAFAFGLIHGFGFAGVLAEQGLPARGMVPSLLAFNVGVELGQLALVACALPVLSALGQTRWTAPTVALAVACLAATFAFLAQAGVARGTLAIVLCGAVPLLAVLSRRWGYPLGVKRVASVVLGLLAVLWFFERVAGRVLFHGVLG